MHTMIFTEATVVECLECSRRCIVDFDALERGDLASGEMVLDYGDTTACHTWSTTPELQVRVGTG